MFSTCSELTPRAPILDGRMEQTMQPCLQKAKAKAKAKQNLIIWHLNKQIIKRLNYAQKIIQCN